MTGSSLQNENRRYVIIHGHFYQPPRENPWLDIIEQQPSAAPARDWNERIYDECYRPNASSRLLDREGMISEIHNNYLNMSFNFGPTLFSWLESKHPATAQRIIGADEESKRVFEGHGNSLAQVFNHIIMPLSSRRDQITQIRWAKQFFKKRFGHNPEGLWLAETAINMETVECLIEERIKFVVLAPSQAEAFRSLKDSGEWVHTSKSAIDTRRPYRLFPKNQAGRKLSGFLDVFFFDEGISKEISFGNLLTDAHILGNRILGCYDQKSSWNQAVIIATDGETFGHHKAFGDMCLAYFFKKVASDLGITPVNFGFFLSKNPPVFEVTLKNAFGEGTAWSCAHGVGRWIRDCGCKTGGPDTWKQGWRTPLRYAFERLQERIDVYFDEEFREITADPWRMRDRYIGIMQNTSVRQMKRFLESGAKGISLEKDKVLKYRRLLEAQKYMLYSFTSCAWFFSDISGIEAMQNMAYACRAIQLGVPEEDQEAALKDLLSDLGKAAGNLPGSNGKILFEKEILPFFDHLRIIAFTATVEKSLGIRKTVSFQDYNYEVKLEPIVSEIRGKLTYDAWKVEFENEYSGENGIMWVLVAHSDSAEIKGWVLKGKDLAFTGERPGIDDWTGNKAARLLTPMDMFRTSQKKMADFFLAQISRDTDSRFSLWFKRNERILDSLSRFGSPLPTYCTEPLAFVIKEQWNRFILQLGRNGFDNNTFDRLLDLYRTSEQFKTRIDFSQTSQFLENFLVAELQKISEALDPECCDRIRYLLNIVDRFAIPISKHKLEDIFYPILYGKVKDLYEQVISGENESEDKVMKREMLIRLTDFARRMNFNTDLFRRV